jgi:hypothetical protein
MKILFISNDFSGASLCLRLKREGNEVRAFVADPLYHQIMDGLIEKTDNLEGGLAWVGRDGLIVIKMGFFSRSYEPGGEHHVRITDNIFDESQLGQDLKV